jgi:hypothetical protein
MPMHIFLCVGSVLIFCWVSRSRQNSNLNRIQISLQIIKRFEKEMNFSNSHLVMGRNRARIQISLHIIKRFDVCKLSD